MISTRLTVTNNPIPELEAFLDSQASIVRGIGNGVVTRFAPSVIGELAKYPGKAKYPIEWTSEKQRRYYFAVIAKRDGNGRIIPYKRTNGLAKAWKVEGDVKGKDFLIVISNGAKSAKYVVGSLAKDDSRAASFQQGFHRNTGWFLANKTANFWLGEMRESFMKEYDKLIGEYGTAGFKRFTVTR